MTNDSKKPKTEVDNKGRRKIILPKRNQPKIQTMSVIPAADILLHDAKCIVASELARYRKKTADGVSLDLKEARVVTGYLESLIRLNKEEREASKGEDLSDMSLQELSELLRSMMVDKPELALKEEDDK